MSSDHLWRDLCAIRERAPLVHNITNYVVMNSTANALLALGASPVMAHAVEEVEEMVELACRVGGALVVNIGTLSPRWVEAMDKAVRAARVRGVPLVLDPVGAGATTYRTATARALMDAAPPTILRGNASEILALADGNVRTKGVDAAHETQAALEAARALARRYRCVVVVSGATDVVVDLTREARCTLGHPMMPRVTGMGCTASAIVGAFAAVNPDAFEAASHGMVVMGLCGQRAARSAPGPGSLQVRFLDELYRLDQAVLAEAGL